MPIWVYVISAILGSLAGAILDYLLYADGGSMFMKIGIAAGPIFVWGIGKMRAQPVEEEDKS